MCLNAAMRHVCSGLLNNHRYRFSEPFSTKVTHCW